MTYKTASLIIWQNQNQNTEAVCKTTKYALTPSIGIKEELQHPSLS